jgi:cytochrome c-type biogenesis protein CcmE
VTGGRWKLVVGGALIVAGLAGLAVWAGLRPEAGSFYVTVSELDDPNLVGQQVRVAGAVVPGSVVLAGDQITFLVSDESDPQATLPVVYSGTVPDTFELTQEVRGWEVIAEGRLMRGPRLEAGDVFVRHPPEMETTRSGADGNTG